MPYTERYLGGILRIETTTKEEQVLEADNMAQHMRNLHLLHAPPGAQVTVSTFDDIRRERVRTTFRL